MSKIVEMKEISFSHGNISVFHNLSLNIQKGTFNTILGSSGSGKSTLARILCGLEPAKGYIKICDLFLNPKNMAEIYAKVAIASEQSLSQIVGNTVLEEISFYLQSLNFRPSEVKKNAEKIAVKFGVPTLLLKDPKKLSMGEKQIVVLMSCLIRNPKILLLDDALSMVDNVEKKKIFRILKEYMRRTGMTILHFTNNSEDMLEGTDVIVLSNGSVVLHKKIEESLQFEKVFSSNHLELPFIYDLSNKLRYYKVIDENYVSEKSLVNALWK